MPNPVKCHTRKRKTPVQRMFAGDIVSKVTKGVGDV